MKRTLSLVLALALSLGLMAGCANSSSTSSQDTGSAPASAAASTGSETAGASDKKYAVVFGGSLGDLGFNDEGYAGFKRAEEELGITFDYAEPKGNSDIEPQMRLFVESGEYDIVFGHGATHADAIKVLATEYPEQRFCLIDGTAEEGMENVSSISARDPEQSFLSGVLAGLVTLDDRMELANPENVLGFAIGLDSPVSRSTAAGFMSGARYVNPEVEFITAFVGDYRDPAKAKEIAMTAYGRGADIVSHNAGGSGLGIFEAGKESGRYAIGSSIATVTPGVSLCTSLKRIDTLIFNEIKSDVDGEWVSGAKKFGIPEGVCDIDFTDCDIEIPQDILDKVQQVKQDVIDGIVAPAYDLPEVDEWTQNNNFDANHPAA